MCVCVCVWFVLIWCVCGVSICVVCVCLFFCVSGYVCSFVRVVECVSYMWCLFLVCVRIVLCAFCVCVLLICVFCVLCLFCGCMHMCFFVWNFRGCMCVCVWICVSVWSAFVLVWCVCGDILCELFVCFFCVGSFV